MAQDTKGKIWLGTGDGGLQRVDGQVLVNETPHTLRVPHAVQCLCTTLDGSVWIGYAAAALAVTPEPAPDRLKTWPGAQVFRIKTQDRKTGAPVEFRLIPFAEAGGTGTRYKVWLPLPRQSSGNLLLDGLESRSHLGNVSGSINDEELQNPPVTFDNQPSKEGWFTVTLNAPTAIRRVVFMHGNNFHDGGWFDPSAGKPKVQIQREKGGAWETIGELADYPATTATNNANLKFGQAFTLQLASPVKALAVRVLGVPACGDNPKQNFSSCAELQTFDP